MTTIIFDQGPTPAELIVLAGIKPPAIQGYWVHEKGSSIFKLPTPWPQPLVSIWQHIADDINDPSNGKWFVDFQSGREFFGPGNLPSRAVAMQLVHDVMEGKRVLTEDEMVMNT